MNAFIIRPEEAADRAAVLPLLEAAFGGDDEARLVAALQEAGDVVLSLVAERAGRVLGHIVFSRLFVEGGDGRFAAAALAPVAVAPDEQGRGIGAALVEEAHLRLREAGECLSIVLGDPAYYARFGYTHARAAGFDSAYQCDALQALAWKEAPESGRLEYPAAFAALG